MSLLQNKEQLFKVVLYYMEKEIDGGICHVILDDKKAEKMLANEKQKDKVSVLIGKVFLGKRATILPKLLKNVE